MHCNNCNYDGEFVNGQCPRCRESQALSNERKLSIKAALKASLDKKEYEKAVGYYQALADMGDAESERELAKLLEDGVLVPQDIDKAVELYKSAAEKNDAAAAYRYSRYAMKESISRGSFWLIYSAVLGEVDAYNPAADELASMGKDVEANYFYTLASNCDHKAATVSLASRYYEGIGFSRPNRGAAKWYLKKYKILPLYALPLAIKLRKVKAEEPPRVEFKEDVFLRSLVKSALEAGCQNASIRLCEMLGKHGDLDSLASGAMMRIKSFAGDAEREEGMRILRECAVRGSSDAYMTFGKLYREGQYINKDIKAAVFNYEMAAKLERADAYEELGDIYTDGKDIERDFVKALGYYEKAAALGSEKGERRAAEIIAERDKLYKGAEAIADSEGKFRLYAISAAMGHPTATFKLAECYEYAIGVKADRPSAYNFYLDAAEMGESAALVPLGRCYFDGFGVNRDFSLALKIFERAERLGDKRAEKYIKAIYENKKKKIAKRVYSQAMRLVHMKKPSEAFELLTLAQKLDYPKAIYSLGCLYEFGMGVPVSKDKAYSMYELAYRMKFRDPRARFKLSILRKVKRAMIL